MLPSRRVALGRVALCAALVLSYARADAAGAVTVFGPKTYRRATGPPFRVRDIFVVINTSLPYKLRIQNGGNGQFPKVSSAVVTLNGIQVLGPSDFGQNVTLIEIPVTLGHLNEIAVELRSQPGSGIVLDIYAASATDTTPPTITAAISPAPNAAGWHNTNATVTFTCSDAGSGIASCPAPVTVSTEGAGQVVSGTARDVAGNSASASVTFNIDKTPPLIAAAASPVPNASGWNNTNVTVNLTCSDSVSGVAGTCPAPVSVSTEGANQSVTRTVSDVAGNSRSASVNLNIDKSQPTITASVTPAPNAAGWNSTNVTVSFACSDGGSGVAGTCPAPVSVSTEGANQNITRTVSDVAGNTRSASVNLNIDKSQPTITASVVPAANAAGWNNTNATVSFTCTGGVSGTTSCPAPIVVASEGASQVVSGTTTNQAGKSASTSVTVNLDKTPPTISASAAPPPNTAGWNNTDVFVQFTCGDGLSGIAACPPAVSVGEEGAALAVPGNAVDAAGNTASVALTLKIDKTAPIVAPAISPAPNAAGWNRTDVTVSFSATDGLSGIDTVSAPQGVATEGASQIVNGTATDRAGNTANVAATVNLDKTLPVVTLDEPVPGTIRHLPRIHVAGVASDANFLESVQVDGLDAGAGGVFSVEVPLELGPHAVTVVARDIADNVGTASASVSYRPLPAIKITSPANLTAFGTSPITISGTIDDPEATTKVGLEQVPAVVSGGTFAATGVHLQEGGNSVTAVAINAAGDAASDSVTLILDTTAPRVVIDSPPSGSVTTEGVITVAGRVNDVVLGTVNSGQAQVTVNNIVATVSNRTFQAHGIALAPGSNSIVATVRDAVGNQDTKTITVLRETAPGPRISVVAGNDQTAGIGQELPQPLTAAVTDTTGNPLPGRMVIFRVGQNNGALVDEHGQQARGLTITTDGQGLARARYVLGTRAGAGNNRVDATSPGLAGAAVFAASGLSHPPAKINVDSGWLQRGVVGQPLPRPFVAVVTDEGHNRLANVPVTFKVEDGGGDFNGESSVTVETDPDGRALVVLTLGPDAGVANNVVSAAVDSLSGSSVAFSASALESGDPAQTRISGVVLDNSNVPLPGVTLRVRGTAIVGASDEQGQFSLAGVAVGDVTLVADGSTVQRPGTWPDLEFDLVTVAGADNTVGMPIYLLPLDLSNGIFVDETHGGTLTLPDYPGFSLTVAPNSATFPDGTRRGTITVTVVHADKVPMVPNFGQQPRFIVTIQPPGVRFDPPAQISHPNVDGLAPGEVTELYSFDHDMGSFVATGTATVSEDGTVLRSDPQTGILKSGWSCGGNPNTAGHAACCPDCKVCNGAQTPKCVADAAQNAHKCIGNTNGNPNKPRLDPKVTVAMPAPPIPGANGACLPDPNGTSIDVTLILDESCWGTCDNGNCKDPPESDRWRPKDIVPGMKDALDKIASNSSCMGCITLGRMRAKLREFAQAPGGGLPMKVYCDPQNPPVAGTNGDACGYDQAPVGVVGTVGISFTILPKLTCGDPNTLVRHEIQHWAKDRHTFLPPPPTPPLEDCASDLVWACDRKCYTANHCPTATTVCP